MFVVVDASVWLSRLMEGDEFHQAAKAWMEHQRKQGVTFVSPSLLLAEVGGVVSRMTGKPELAASAVKRIANLPEVRIIEMDKPLIDEAARVAAKYGLRGADSVYAAVASRLGIPLATFDVDQRARASKFVDVVEIAKK